MSNLLPLTWVFLALAAFLIGLSKIALPGLALVSVAMFAALIPARQSTALALLCLVLGDLIAIVAYRRDARWEILRGLVWPVLAGLLGGAVFLNFADDGATTRLIAAILLLLTGYTIWHNIRRERSVDTGGNKGGLAYGVLGGFTTMVANAGGPPMNLYLLGCGLEVRKFLGTTAWFFFVVNLLKLPFSASVGLIDTRLLWVALLLAPAVLAGAATGLAVVKHIKPRVFDYAVLTLTAASSLWLLF